MNPGLIKRSSDQGTARFYGRGPLRGSWLHDS